MARAAASVELDFFGNNHRDDSSCTVDMSQYHNKFLHRQRSFHRIQNAISKIDPELVKSVIYSNRSDQNSLSFPAPSLLNNNNNPVFGANSDDNNIPLTIFYNGSVSVFNLPRDKAESILKLAVQGCPGKVESEVAASPSNPPQPLTSLDGDMPLARGKSLQRFLEKRKERVTSIWPYPWNT